MKLTLKITKTLNLEICLNLDYWMLGFGIGWGSWREPFKIQYVHFNTLCFAFVFIKVV